MITKKTKFNEENMQNAFENFKEIENELEDTRMDTYSVKRTLYTV